MRVLFVYDSISPIGGGSQLAIFTWLKNLNQKKIETKLLTGNISQKVEKKILDKLILNPSLNLSFFYPHFHLSIFLNSETRKKILSFSPQIIHLHEPSILSFFILKLAKKNKIKTLISFHTNFNEAKSHTLWFFSLFRKLITSYQFYLLKESDFIAAPSNYYQKLLQKEGFKKIFILPYPIKNQFFIENKKTILTIPKIFKLITVSRLSAEKRIDFLIEMMSYLSNNFQLTIVGDGVDRKFLEKKVKELSLNSKIIFTGWIRNEVLPRFLKQHHLFVSASSFETFGISYIESLACGLPLIVFDYPVTREIIPKEMAIFIKELDPKKWAEELMRIKNEPKKYLEMKKQIFNNYQKILKYKQDYSTKILINIYKKILNEK
jgi:1,2-diacylglycerol 3-alpha-glucosyltransferase